MMANKAVTPLKEEMKRSESALEPELEQAHVILWSAPRSTSTVFLKSMSKVPDIDIFCEPFYYAYEAELSLKAIGTVVDHDNDDLNDEEWRRAATMICEEDCSDDRVKLEMLKYPGIKKALDAPDPTKKVIFVKEVSQSMSPDHHRFLPDASSHYRHSFLLRHPAKVLNSWRKIIHSILKELGDGTGKKLTMSLDEFHLARDVPKKYNISDDCFKNLYDMWIHVKDSGLDPNPVVLDSDDLLSDPPGMLSRYFDALGIPYSDSLLQWDSGPETIADWKSAFMPATVFKFNQIFFKNAFASSHFLPPGPIPSFEDLTDDVKDAVQKSMPYYEAIYKTRILPDQ